MKDLARYIPVFVLAALAGLIMAALLNPKVSGFGAHPLLGKPMPAFQTTSREGQTVTSADLVGKPVLLNFFASWCTPCRLEHPVLLQAAQNKNIRVLGVVYGQDPNLESYLTENNNPFELVLRDPGGRVALTLGISGVPETFMLDANGTVRFHHTGALTSDLLADALEEAKVTP